MNYQRHFRDQAAYPEPDPLQLPLSWEPVPANIANSTKLSSNNSGNKGVKYDSDKPNTALLPPLSLLGVARVLGMGANKYGPDNWRGGIEYRRLLGAAIRHILAYADGEDVDPESGLSHIHHAATNLLFLGQFIEEKRVELDDRYKRPTA